MPNCTETLQLQDLTIPLLRSSKRRSLGIKIANAQVQLYAPLSLDLADIECWVKKKIPWIRKQLLQQQHTKSQQSSSRDRFVEGACFNFLGAPLQLCFENAQIPSASISASALSIQLAPHARNATQVRQCIQHAFTLQAHQYLNERIKHFCPQLGRWPTRITIKEYKSRWGSCNAKRELTFNWLLFQAPSSIVDYVIVHELCHLIHLDHSPRFWQLVAKLCPNYTLLRQWLKTQGHSLFL